MGEEPTRLAARVAETNPSPPPAALVRDAVGALRAADVHLRVLCDRLDLARAGHLRLDRLPAELLLQLVATAEALEAGAGSALERIDGRLAGKARTLAGLARMSARDYEDRCE